jgi:hypothetical protein
MIRGGWPHRDSPEGNRKLAKPVRPSAGQITRQAEFCYSPWSGVAELQGDEALALARLDEEENRLAALALGLLEAIPDVGHAGDRLAGDLQNAVAGLDTLHGSGSVRFDIGDDNTVFTP